MRPFTEALLSGNMESLTRKGWKTDEQRRCFKKADALLDYISRIKPSEYSRWGYYKKLNPQRAEGLRCCLEKNMPSKKMQRLSLDILLNLLSMGDQLLERSAWAYKRYPALFKAKYASSPQAFQKDIHGCFVRGYVVPENSFEPFKTGENPVLNRGNAFSSRCVELYTDPIFESSEFQERCKKRDNKDPYVQWIRKYRSGRRYIDEKRALTHAIEQLAMAKEIELKVDKTLLRQAVLCKKTAKVT